MNSPSEIANAGGAYVRRTFTMGERVLTNQDKLTKQELARIPRANLKALIEGGKIELYPAAPEGDDGGLAKLGKLANHLVHLGGGKYIVVRGVTVTKKAVTRAEAEKIAESTIEN